MTKTPSASRLSAASFMDFWEEATSGKLENDVDDPVPTMYIRLIACRIMSTMPANCMEKLRYASMSSVLIDAKKLEEWRNDDA